MRAVAQRVLSGRVVVQGEVVGEIGPGLLVYLAVARNDGPEQAAWMANKLAGLRIFPDQADRMSRDVTDVRGSLLLVPQFTLFGDVRRGRRPSFDDAAEPDRARMLCDRVCLELENKRLQVARGRFRASMIVESQVDGPVTILIDSDKQF